MEKFRCSLISGIYKIVSTEEVFSHFDILNKSLCGNQSMKKFRYNKTVWIIDTVMQSRVLSAFSWSSVLGISILEIYTKLQKKQS